MVEKVIHASGKRKRAIARATLKKGTGLVTVNSKPLEYYNPNHAKLRIEEPLILAGEIASQVDISVNVYGGGVVSQSDASRLAIGRALAKHSSKLKQVFLNYDRLLLVADVRRKETCKPNDSKPRAKRQKSYR
ncbi:30S ribosomal protein S9 [Candidatus Woesearchaeota archaeon]|nr:30S ribosomal protein S9 [Candidatus Woesearchaeota archaeon]